MPVPDFSPGEIFTAGAADSIGLWKVGEFTASGTSRALVCDNIFTSDFTNYRVVIHMVSTANDNGWYFQYLNSVGSTVTANYHSSSYGQDFSSGTTGFTVLNANTLVSLGFVPNSATHKQNGVALDVFNPFVASLPTVVTGQFSTVRSGTAFQAGTIYSSGEVASHRGIRFDNGSGTNLTGTVRVYGYRN
jgi:hypothetical protein